jgi:hypothetical protein
LAPWVLAFGSEPAWISIFTAAGPLGKNPGQSVTTCKSVFDPRSSPIRAAESPG